MKNAVVAALTSALVAVGFAGASIPVPVGGGRVNTTARDINKLRKEVTALKANLGCFNGNIVQLEVQKNADGTTYYVQPDSDQDASAIYVPTVDASCVG